MTAAKIAVTVPEDVLRLAKKHVKAGKSKSLSAFVGEAMEERLARDQLSEILDQMDLEHGQPSKKAEAWAKRVLKRSF
jgi:Arc/MetJ-type ribon-helix-helix transcriptional regulator